MDYTEQAGHFTENSVKENNLYLFNILTFHRQSADCFI